MWLKWVIRTTIYEFSWSISFSVFALLDVANMHVNTKTLLLYTRKNIACSFFSFHLEKKNVRSALSGRQDHKRETQPFSVEKKSSPKGNSFLQFIKSKKRNLLVSSELCKNSPVVSEPCFAKECPFSYLFYSRYVPQKRNIWTLWRDGIYTLSEKKKNNRRAILPFSFKSYRMCPKEGNPFTFFSFLTKAFYLRGKPRGQRVGTEGLYKHRCQRTRKNTLRPSRNTDLQNLRYKKQRESQYCKFKRRRFFFSGNQKK